MTNLDYLYKPEAAKEIVNKNYFVDKKLHFRIIERGTILPHKHMYVNGQWTWGFGGIVDNRNEFVKESFVNSDGGGAYTPNEGILHAPATVIYLGMFYPVWGHAITDNLRRLWFLKSDVFKNYFKDCPIVYIPWNRIISLEHQKNFSRLLEILEIDVRRLQPVYRPVQFENIILPDESFTFGYFTAEYRETIDRVRNFALKNRTPTPSEKIYYFYGTAQFGEERLAEYFKSKGYEIISPEKLTLDEQLNLLINAKSFASTLGSCAHNSIFLRDGAEAIFIPRAAERFTDHQGVLNQVHPLNVNYVDSSLSVFEKFNGIYCFIISEQLKKFFKEKFKSYSQDDLKIFLAYVKHCMSRGFPPNQQALKYYGAIHDKFLEQINRRKDLLAAYGMTSN